MSKSVIDIFEKYLGTSVNQKTLGKVLSKISHSQAIELHDRIKAFYATKYYFVDSGEPLKFSVDEVRYAILTDSAGEMDSYEIWQNDEPLKKLLLYYPTVSVLDPVDELLSLFAEHPPSLEDTLSKLLTIRPLIDKDIVRLIPGVTSRTTVLDQLELSPFLNHVLADDEFVRALRIYDSKNYDTIVQMNLDLMGSMLTYEERAITQSLIRKDIPKGLLVWAASVIKEIYTRFLIADLTDSNMTIVSPKETELYTKLLGAELELLPRLGKIDDYLAPFILSLNLPNICNLSWDDLLSIRQNDEDFYFWREALKKIMKESYDSDKLSEKEFFQNAKEILSARSKLLRDSIKQKLSIKNKFMEAAIPAGIGFAGGLLTGSIEAALGSSALTGSLSFLYSLFAKRAQSSEKALFRHFSILLENYKKSST